MFPSKLLDLTLSPQPQSKREEYLQVNYWSLPVVGQTSDMAKLVRPFHALEREQMRREMLDEANIEGENIMTECNRLLMEISSTPSPKLEDIFKTIAISKDPATYQERTHMKRFTGRLKFFDEAKNYGFIVMDLDGSDIFVYADDLQKTGLPRDFLRTAKQGNLIRFQFTCMNYVGKYNQSRKAIDLKYLKLTTPMMGPCAF